MSAKFASVVVGAAAVMCSMAVAGAAGGKDAYYTEEHVYWSRPNPGGEMSLGDIGVTGLKVRIDKGVVVKVVETVPGTPAEGQFKAGQIIAGINGAAFKGKDPVVALGSALTQAEATDGKMIFDVQDADDASAKRVTVTIPVLGAYSKTWPLQCEKSATIIKQAAEYYSTNKAFQKKYFEEKGVGGALTCLFLLSTGDDKYIPCVKEYFAPFIKNPKGIGDHTWHNGYNGIACAEYYLRTGDKDVLPVLQYYCQNAQERQMFGCGWTHWGRGIWPGYVAGGLMNPAGSQVLTTLLLSKECGVDVDEKTLLGALRFFYRFTGHGTVPYGDHRPEGGLQSNGKDGMAAAAMLIASYAQGDTSIYTKARDCYSLAMIDSYPGLVLGHADNGRGDSIWRGLTSSYLIDKKAPEYRAVMKRLEWWYDLSRRPSGALGNSACQGYDDEGTGAALALTYTAPLKTLRITGAPRSKVAKDFKLPEHLWGRPADRAFLSIDDNPKYSAYGKSEPTHVPFWKYGSAYTQPEVDLKSEPRAEMLKNVYHRNYMIRVQAAKALRVVGALDELEKLLQDPDPRVRRAGLDGIIDYNYWGGMGGSPLKTEALTPAMLSAIKKMVADPQEALWVVDGALMALSLAPPQEINSCLPLIMPWTTHEDWWLRESSFVALMGLEKEDQLFQPVLPTLITMMVKEYHTMPRDKFKHVLQEAMSRKKVTSPQGAQILAGFMCAVQESEIKPGDYAPEGGHNVVEAARVCLQKAPEKALQVAKTIKARLPQLAKLDIINLIGAPSFDRQGRSSGFYTALKKLPQEQRQELTDMLCGVYRDELIKRIKYGSESDSEHNMTVVDTVLDLAKLRNPNVDWQVLGKPAPAGRTWRYCSVDPQPADVLDRRERERFRDITLPAGLEKWTAPGFDDSKWKAGKAPIGTGLFKQGDICFTNNSDWGSGEFLLARTTFELEEVDCDICRACVLAVQGFRVYLNGKEITSYLWTEDKPHYKRQMINADQLKKGTNVLAVYCNAGYDKDQLLGQIDVFLEGLKKNDLETAVCLAGMGNVPTAVQANEYAWRQGANSVALLNRGKVVWQLNYDKAEGKPYFHPLSTVDGSVLSWLRPGDHPWHRALWFSWKHIDGLNYWEEDGKTGLSAGRTDLTGVKVSAAADFSARIEMTLSYHPPEKEEVLSEKRVVEVSAPQPDGCYRIDWASRFAPAASNAVLGRTPIPGETNGVEYGGYAGLSLRMAKETRGWTFVDSEGREGSAIHGKKSEWVNGSGKFAEGLGGVAIFSHPANVRQPASWYIFKDMPYFSPAVLFDEPLVLEKGKVLELKYRILVHGGAVDRAFLGNEWKGYAYGKGFAWESSVPSDCPFPKSPSLTGLYFTGRHSDYRCGDTFYPSWASDGNLYSPWTDGKTDGVVSESGKGADAQTGHAVMIGDDPLKLEIRNTSAPKVASALPYHGRYPAGSLVYNDIWYYGTYCLGPEGSTPHNGFTWNWPNLGPMPGFQISRDFGKTWEPSPHTPEKPLFPEPEKFLGPVKMGAPHFVDFGKNMEHSPDGKAYLIGMGAEENDPKPRPCIKLGKPGETYQVVEGCTNDFAHANLSWVTADQAYLARVTPSPETINDPKAYEFFAGHDSSGQPVWTRDFKKIKPLVEWNNHMGCVTATYVPGLKKYLMCVTDGWPTVAKMTSYILEADKITGPWRMVCHMKDFGEQAYFLNFPSKFISPDGKTLWLCYSANFSPGWNGVKLSFNPPGGRYGLCLHEVRLMGPGDKR